MPDELAFLSATRLIERFRSREISPVEATRRALDRIAIPDGALNAFCLVDEAAALDAARRSEARWAKGVPRGRLDGVPVSIKDLMLTTGWPTRRGSTLVARDQPWEEDAPAVARLRAHGAVLLGKTTTPEFGWKGVTDSPLTGISRNPWDRTKTPGGSSGGSAAAVAAGMGPLSVGSDGGGSIRIPSAFCGTVGLKASFGRIPVYPPSPFGTLSHVGPITRTVADAALMLTVLGEPDGRDWHALPSHQLDYTAALDGRVAGLRIAYSANLGGHHVEPEVAAAVDAAARTFEEMGAHVEAAEPDLAEAHDVFCTLWFVGAARIVNGYPPEARGAMDPGLVTVAERGAAYDLDAYLDAVETRTRLGMRLRAFHQRYDLLVTPTMPTVAFAAGKDQPIGPDGEEWVDWSPFTYPFNLTSQPAISVPCGFTSAGLPVGLQIVGRNFDDAAVLRAAEAYQHKASTLDRRPIL